MFDGLHRDARDRYLRQQAAHLRHIQTADGNVTRWNKQSSSLRGNLKNCKTTLDEDWEAKSTRSGRRASEPRSTQPETEEVPRNISMNFKGLMTRSCSDPGLDSYTAHDRFTQNITRVLLHFQLITIFDKEESVYSS